MKWIHFVGLVAAMISTSAFTPQVIKSFRTKKTDDISLLMYIVMGIGIILWLFYGFMIKNIPLIFGNIVSLTFVLMICYLKLRHSQK